MPGKTEGGWRTGSQPKASSSSFFLFIQRPGANGAPFARHAFPLHSSLSLILHDGPQFSQHSGLDKGLRRLLNERVHIKPSLFLRAFFRQWKEKQGRLKESFRPPGPPSGQPPLFLPRAQTGYVSSQNHSECCLPPPGLS